MTAPQVTIISSGEELITGHTADANGPFMAAELTVRGLAVKRIVVVGDNPGMLRDELARATQDSDVVIVTGGLGPTADDRTREAISQVVGAELAARPEAIEHVRRIIEEHGHKMTEAHARQACFPQNADLMPNPRGTAIGFVCRVGRARLFVMPGVPSEMRGMFQESVLPALLTSGREKVAVGTVNIFGVPESHVDARLADMLPEDRNPLVGLKVDDGVVYVCLRARAESDANAQALLEQDARTVESRFGEAVFGRNDITLARAVSDLLERRNVKVAVAESCTGGLVGGLLTEVPGMSRFFLADIVAYSNEAKESQLRVPAQELRSFGAVSEQVAASMARGVCEVTGAQLGISATGIAGPTGGTAQKPVGLVYVGICLDSQVSVHTLNLKGDRLRIRDRAAKHALNFARLTLMHAPAGK